MSDERDAYERAHERKVQDHMEKMERETFENFRGVGFTKGEAMRAANKLGQTVAGANDVFREKIYNETGVDVHHEQ